MQQRSGALKRPVAVFSYAVACGVLAGCGGGRGASPPVPAAPNQPGTSAAAVRALSVDAAEARRIRAKVVSEGAHALAVHGRSKAGAASAGRTTRSSDPRDLTYYGGPTLSSAVSYDLYVNCDASCWGTPSTFQTNLAASGMIHLVDQYVNALTNNRYPFGGSVAISYAINGTLSDNDIYAIVHQAAASLGTGYGAIYHVFLPQGTAECSTVAGGCYSPNDPAHWTFCAYHGNTDYSDIGHVLYSVEPYQNVSATYNGQQLSCTAQYTPNGAVVDATASTLSHELFEAITDPDVPNHLAWYNYQYGEVGDICRWTATGGPVTINGVPYGLQKEYSNQDHDCVFGPPTPLLAHTLSIAPDGTVWLLGGFGSSLTNIYKYTGGALQQIGGSASDIAVDSNGAPWVVNSVNAIYHYDPASNSFVGPANGSAIDITTGPNNAMWVVGVDASGTSGNHIYEYTPPTYAQIPGAAVDIAIDQNGLPWALDNASNIYRYTSTSTSVQVAGSASRIAIGINGGIWCLGVDQGSSGHSIYHWNGSAFVQVPGQATEIAVDPNGNAWVVNLQGGVYQYSPSAGFQQVTAL